MTRVRELVARARAASVLFNDVRGPLIAAGLAYFVALSIAPMAIALGALAGLFLDPADIKAVLENLAREPSATVGTTPAVVATLTSIIENASATAFTIATVIAILVAVYGASKIVVIVRTGLADIFGEPHTPARFMQRVAAALVTLVGLVAAVLVVILLTLVPKLLEAFGVVGLASSGTFIVDWLLVFVAIYLLSRLLFRHGSSGRKRDVPWLSLGVAVAAVGVTGVTIGVGIYVNFSGSLGAAIALLGTAAVVLLWLYLCFLAVVWGAAIEAGRTTEESGLGEPAGRTEDESGRESGDGPADTH